MNDALRLSKPLLDAKSFPHLGITTFEQIKAIGISPDFQLHRELAKNAFTVASYESKKSSLDLKKLCSYAVLRRQMEK
jgi:hypothetical protein